MAQQLVTKVLQTLTPKDKATKTSLEKLIGRPLGSPINGKQEGDKFDVTLTGNIEIRDFNGQKGAYFTTNEGYSIRVNATFSPEIHKAGAKMEAVCLILKLEGSPERKYCAFA